MEAVGKDSRHDMAPWVHSALALSCYILDYILRLGQDGYGCCGCCIVCEGCCRVGDVVSVVLVFVA